MKIIGRERECYELKRCVESPRPEFVAVYGRRRVGKTYLVDETFAGRITHIQACRSFTSGYE